MKKKNARTTERSKISEMRQRINQIVAEQLAINTHEVKPESSLVGDLKADSLDLIELVMAFEEEFNAEIPDEAAAKITTVQQIYDYAKERKFVLSEFLLGSIKRN